MRTTNFAKRLLRVVMPMSLATTVLMAQGQTQTTPPPSQQKPSGQKPTTTQGQRPVFRARTDYISTDLRITNNKGVFVSGLTREDFQVFEDGVLQKIVTFQPVVGGRALASYATPTMPKLDGIILPQRAAPTDTAGRIFIVFIDDMHLQPSDTPIVRQTLKQIRDEVLKENDIVSTGFSSIAVDLTYDPAHKRMNEAIEKVMGSAETPREIIDLPLTTGGVQKLRYNANVAFKTAYDILAQANRRIDRRKAFLYVSSGYSFNPFKDSRFEKAKEMLGIQTAPPDEANGGGTGNPTLDNRLPGENPFDRPGSEFAEMDLISELAYLTDEARRANVVFYTIDPRGLQAGPNIADRLTQEEWRDFWTTSISSLHILGDNTGGFCVCEKNDLKPWLQRIDSEMSDYYIIGYNTNNPDPMKLRRRIEIKVNRKDVKLDYKTEYTLPKSQRTGSGK
jgi:VWFA-related protein